jgi:hypothetical protein
MTDASAKRMHNTHKILKFYKYQMVKGEKEMPGQAEG